MHQSEQRQVWHSVGTRLKHDASPGFGKAPRSNSVPSLQGVMSRCKCAVVHWAEEVTRRDTDLRCRESIGKVSTASRASSGARLSATASSRSCMAPDYHSSLSGGWPYCSCVALTLKTLVAVAPLSRHHCHVQGSVSRDYNAREMDATLVNINQGHCWVGVAGATTCCCCLLRCSS